jgi:hypothetical protein
VNDDTVLGVACASVGFWHDLADRRSAELVIMTERAEAAEAQCAALEQCVAAWQETARLGEEHWRRALNAECDLRNQAEAQCAAMREALEQVELVSDGDHSGDDYCPWCGMLRWMTRHGPDCKREGALATDAGTALLAEVRRLREFAAAWKAVQDYEVGELDAIEPLHPFTPEWEAVVRDYGERFPAVYGRWQHAIKAVLPGYERCSCPTCRPDLAALDATEPSP